MSTSEIAEFYKGRSVFVTGATGFLGKCIVEKLLRECPQVEKIYVFARPSKNVAGSERVKELLTGELFDTLRAQRPNFAEKIIPIEGDLVLEGLGMSSKDTEEVRANVSVILHCAATVNFNEKLNTSLKINVVSTQRLLTFAKSMPNMAAFVHVSTAYAHCDRLHIEEKFYPPTVNPQSLIDLVCNIQDETLIANMTKPLIGKRPNTYTFTKSLAEDVVRTEKDNLPVAIVRPSIICGSNDGPVKGWTDNLNGPGGFYLAVAHHLLRAIKGSPNAIADIVPVDFCANMIIAAAWRTATHPTENVLIYNCTSGSRNPLPWRKKCDIVLDAIIDRPPTKPSKFLKPSFTIVTNETVYDYIVDPILNQVPIYIFDVMATLQGKKANARRIFRRIKSSLNSYLYFASHNWKWDDDNVQALISSLNEYDVKAFNCDVTTINWFEYFNNYYDSCTRFARTGAKFAPPAEGSAASKKELSATSAKTAAAAAPFSPVVLMALFCLVLLAVTLISWSFFGHSLDGLRQSFNNTTGASSSCSNGQLGNLLECNN